MQININKQTIIIALIVVAVSAYLIWKKRQSEKALAGMASEAGNGLNKHDVNDVIKAAGLTGSKATLVAKEVKYLKSNLRWNAAIEETAETKGRTYEQQLVIEALYAFHYKKADADWKISKSQFEAYWHAIDAM